jgi:hypothetical protein
MIKKLSLLVLAISLFNGCSSNQDLVDKPQSSSENSSGGEDSIKEVTTITDSPAKTPPKNDKGDIKDKPGISKESVEKMTPSISYKLEGKNVHFTFNVKNNLDHLFTFHFETAQQYDYTIKDRDGNVLRTYSKETKTPTLPGEQPVKPGGSISYEVPVENLPPGSYVITFFLKAKEMQPKAALEFVVE